MEQEDLATFLASNISLEGGASSQGVGRADDSEKCPFRLSVCTDCPSEELLARHYILVFKKSEVDASCWLVFGMTAWEYKGRYAYIQHVDTTHISRPPLLVKSIIVAYLKWLNLIGIKRVHFLAMPRPSLLFCESEVWPEKRVLDGSSLIIWWLSVLVEAAVCGEVHQVWCLSCNPLSFPLFTNLVKEALLLLDSLPPFTEKEKEGEGDCKGRLNTKWTYGHGHAHTSDPRECLHNFPDDPKTKQLLDLYDDHNSRFVEDCEELGSDHLRSAKRTKHKREPMRIDDFFQILSFRSEFSLAASALMTVELQSSFSDSLPTMKMPQYEYSKTPSFLAKFFPMLSFGGDEESFRASSMKIWAFLKLTGHNSLQLSRFKEERGQGGSDELRNSTRKQFMIKKLKELLRDYREKSFTASAQSSPQPNQQPYRHHRSLPLHPAQTHNNVDITGHTLSSPVLYNLQNLIRRKRTPNS